MDTVADMRPHARRRTAVQLLVLAACAGAGALLASIGGSAEASRGTQTAPEAAAPPATILSGLDARAREIVDGVAIADLPEGRRAVLTVDTDLEAHVRAELERYQVPYASVVAIEPSTGRVLAYVSHSSANPGAPDLALDAGPPAASVFKIITGAALLESGVAPDTEVCYGGGASALSTRDLEDDPARDRQCATLAEAMGGSINAVFAKLSTRHLDDERLSRYAAAFGFGQTLPFDVRVQPSAIDVPDSATERLEFARTSAGFWHSHLSPMHAALVAATIANDGRMPRAHIVDRVLDASGHVVRRTEPGIHRSVVTRATADTLTAMMEHTVTSGTARRAFHDEHGLPFLPGIRVAGKTGTLSGTAPYRGYTWFVGFAPADAPTIAVATLVVNTPLWRIKASYMARETLRHYLVSGRNEAPSAPPPPSDED